MTKLKTNVIYETLFGNEIIVKRFSSEYKVAMQVFNLIYSGDLPEEYARFFTVNRHREKKYFEKMKII